ncbi:11968_t:CDS:2, partial [Racocetra persica]
MNEEIILYDEGPVASLISVQEEDNRSILDLFDYYYEKRSCFNIKYNIGEVEDNQRKQLLELLRENPNLCAQDISELGQTDIIQHCIPTQDSTIPSSYTSAQIRILKLKTHHYLAREGLLYKKNPRNPFRPLQILKLQEVEP